MEAEAQDVESRSARKLHLSLTYHCRASENVLTRLRYLSTELMHHTRSRNVDPLRAPSPKEALSKSEAAFYCLRGSLV